MTPRPVVLCILDGWGQRADPRDNAIAQAKTPNWTRLLAESPHTLVQTSGEAVGLPAGQMGNSEVGHMNIGGGRIILQDLDRIDTAARTGALAANPVLQDMIARVTAKGGALHILGLLSPGGVHSHQAHIAALANAAAASGVRVWVHAFLDGRDTPPRSALDYLAQFARDVAASPGVRIATVGGRYFGMDRDKRWDRVAQAFAAIVHADAPRAASPAEGVEASYANDVSDEFVSPVAIGDYPGMRDGDAVLMANFRADRARQIMTALTDPAFDGFPRGRMPALSAAATMTEYSAALSAGVPALFAAEKHANTLGAYLSAQGKTQLRLAETEKYAHVTYFFNGGEEAQFAGEERVMVPSPKVATYDLKPEMSASEVTERLVDAVRSGRFDLIVVNYANPDMVGHTGDLAAAVKAVETVDACLGRVAAAVAEAGGVLLITADHGNLEMMRDDATGQAHTAHTLFDVPTVLVNARVLGRSVSLAPGRLSDIAPTILELMDLPQPPEMTGRSLLRGGA